MSRTIKKATVKRYCHDTHSQLETHVPDFIAACNDARRLKTLQSLAPSEYICKTWPTKPALFNINPTRHTLGMNGRDTAQAKRRQDFPGIPRAIQVGGFSLTQSDDL